MLALPMHSHSNHSEPIRIAGAGLAGLSAAVSLARSGHRVEIYEKNCDSGEARQEDWDTIENWTTEQDFCNLLPEWGLASDFDLREVDQFDIYDHAGAKYPIHTPRPVFYLVRRGTHPASIEQRIKQQALNLGVVIQYGQPARREEVDIWAAGLQRNGFFLEVGVTFHTHHPDVVVGLISTAAAPKAYAYLVVVAGVGKIVTVLTQNFQDARALLNQTIDTFQRIEKLDIQDVQMLSGFGGLPSAFREQAHHPLVVGEAAGFQDFLWGFGIRQALLSGRLAARAIHAHQDYETLVAQEIRPMVRSSFVNRMFYDLAGDNAYRTLLRWFTSSSNLHASIRRFYTGDALQNLLWPLAWRRYQSRLVYVENEVRYN
ncbi:MAG: NAD(P)-binding protein [Anaerolineaceae bacterium]|nr:NAD(P)-binding protein [Anaerolineaceae bacterium]